MNEFNENDVLNYEGLKYLVGKYKEKNPISRLLMNGFYRSINSIVKRIETTDRILEVGCGAGISSLRIQRMLNGQYFEVSDIDENAILQFKKIGFPIPFKQESVLELARRDGEFECVFLLEVLEHVPEYRKALSEVFRVSNKYVVVSSPNEPMWRLLNMLRGRYLQDWGNTPGHINHWSSSMLLRLVTEFGQIENIFTPLPWTIVLAKVI